MIKEHTRLMKIVWSIKNDPVRRECGQIVEREKDFALAKSLIRDIIETEIKYLRLALEDLEELES